MPLETKGQMAFKGMDGDNFMTTVEARKQGNCPFNLLKQNNLSKLCTGRRILMRVKKDILGKVNVIFKATYLFF